MEFRSVPVYCVESDRFLAAFSAKLRAGGDLLESID